jgi:DNA-directed RNA polymerase subunit beta
MEVWALEAFGAAYTLQELLTLKSDDIAGRNKVFSAIMKGSPLPKPSIPEALKVTIHELQALCLDISAYKLEAWDPEETKLIAGEVLLTEDSEQGF